MRTRLKLLALYVGVAFLTRLVLLGVPIVDLDEAAYLTVAREILRGGTLYLDAADHKPPLVFLYYALGQLLLGPGMLGVRLLTHLVVVPLVAYAASAFYRHERRGVVAALLFLVYGASFLGHDMLAVNCELLMLAPLSLALLLVRDEEAAARPARLFAAGLLVGVATLFKYQAAAWAAALSFVSSGAAAVAAPWLGLAVPLVAAYAAFARIGAADAFLYWNLGHNLAYAASSMEAGEAAGRVLRYVLPLLLATAPLWWAAWASRRLLSRQQRRLVVSTAALSLATAFLGLRFYPHYFIPLYLPLALGAAPWVEARLAAPRGRALRSFVAWTAVLFLGLAATNAHLYYARSDVYAEARPVFREVAGRLRDDPCFGNGPLFVWGFAPSFYAETDLRPASRFILVGFTLVGYVPGSAGSERGRSLVRPEHWDWLMADLARKPPSYVLDTARARLGRWAYPLEDYPRLAGFVASGYERIDAVDGVLIYRRRGCASR